jgi:hypothetical protein
VTRTPKCKDCMFEMNTDYGDSIVYWCDIHYKQLDNIVYLDKKCEYYRKDEYKCLQEDK